MGQSANAEFYQSLRNADALDYYDSRYLLVGSVDADVATFLANPTSANLYTAMNDKTGTGLLVFNTDPQLVRPQLSAEIFSTSATVTAGSDAQGQGALTADLNVITTTGTSPVSGVTLPVPTVGRRVYVVNKGTVVVNIYPSASTQIDALGVNAAIRLPKGYMWEFNASSATQWHSSRTQFSAGDNVAVGNLCLPVVTTAGASVAVGYQSLSLATTGGNNVAVGYQCLQNLVSGTDNVAVGFQALRNNTGNDNLALGSRALRDCTGGDNVAFGSSALISNSTGTRNTGFGRETMALNTKGQQNVAIGYKAGVVFNFTASPIDTNNTFIGAWAGRTLTTGVNNTFIGSGIESANNCPGITTGSYNTVIGAGINGLAAALANTVVIGDGQNNIRLVVNSSGNLGVGTTWSAGSPVVSAKFHVISTTTPQCRIGNDVNNYMDVSVSSAGAVTFDAIGSGAGFLFGSSSSKKIGFYGVTPVVQSAAYTVSNYTTDRSIDKSTATLGEAIDVLLTLIADLKLTGIIG